MILYYLLVERKPSWDQELQRFARFIQGRIASARGPRSCSRESKASSQSTGSGGS